MNYNIRPCFRYFKKQKMEIQHPEGAEKSGRSKYLQKIVNQEKHLKMKLLSEFHFHKVLSDPPWYNITLLPFCS